LLRLPESVRSKPEAERREFLQSVLSDELSRDGLESLRSKGQFGAMRDIFPVEADRWARLFSVNPDDCVAFRMENSGVRAELVLLRRAEGFTVLRCNNVKQMAVLHRAKS
jgi:hypothetical protein